jgi:hypothetical protein
MFGRAGQHASLAGAADPLLTRTRHLDAFKRPDLAKCTSTGRSMSCGAGVGVGLGFDADEEALKKDSKK